MKKILITIAAVLLVGCGESKELVKLEGFIVNKKLYFTLNSDENAKFCAWRPCTVPLWAAQGIAIAWPAAGGGEGSGGGRWSG